MNDREIRRNASGYYDPTAYKAILNTTEAERSENRLKSFLKDIFRVCKYHGIYLERTSYNL